jgi:poly(A) polymerase
MELPDEELHSFLLSRRAIEPIARFNEAFAEVQDLAQTVLTTLAPEQSKSATLVLRVFGSLALGICSADTDVDAVCIAPNFVTRERFFSEFAAVLGVNPNIRSVEVILNARVPIIAFRFREIDFDVSFVCLNLPTIPPDFDPSSDAVFSRFLFGRNQTDVLTLCGIRNALYLKRAMKRHKAAFRNLVRFVRVWAKSRLIYGHCFGFISGIECQLLSAHIIRRHAGETELVERFFEFCGTRDWHREPFKLTEVGTLPGNQWNEDKMVILTPVYPAQNTARMATAETVAVMKREFEIGLRKCRESCSWEEFVECPELLPRCTRAIQVQFWALNPDDFQKWKGFMESRIYGMLITLIRTGNACYRGTPLPLTFVTPGEKGHTHCGCFFFGLMGKPKSRLTLKQIIDRKGNRIFAYTGAGGASMSAEEISINRFRALMASEPYASQLPGAAVRESG